MRDCEEAIFRVILGPERKSRIISDEQKRLTAYHEAGHALVGHLLPNCDPIRKITIIPRGMSGGLDVRHAGRRHGAGNARPL